MRSTSIALVLLLAVQTGWCQEQEKTPPARTTTPPTRTNTPPARTTTPPTRTTTPPTRTNTPTRQAPDGDNYKPAESVRPTPKPHPPETNPGRPPAGPRGGDSAGALIGGAAAAGGVLALGSWIAARNRPAAKLARDGPKVADRFNMSSFSVAAFCQSNWPVVIDLVLTNGGEMSIDVVTEGYPTFTYRIRSNTGRRRQIIFQLPASFPGKPTPGMYTVNATSAAPGVATPVYSRIFGMGGGKRAVGSVAIDQVKFGPDTIRPKLSQEAVYEFHAHTDFDRVRAEFLKAVTAQGQIISVLEDHDDINGVQRETTSTRRWNGKKASAGEHLLQVRAWESALAKSNWVIAWSADQVLVEE